MDVGLLAQLGVASIAVIVIWWIVKQFSEERARHDKEMGAERKMFLETLERKEQSIRQLESDVRNSFAAVIQENTNERIEHAKTMKEHTKIMKEVATILVNIHKGSK